jgi:hypothetical protein
VMLCLPPVRLVSAVPFGTILNVTFLEPV